MGSSSQFVQRTLPLGLRRTNGSLSCGKRCGPRLVTAATPLRTPQTTAQAFRYLSPGRGR